MEESNDNNVKSEPDIRLKKLVINMHSAVYVYLPLQNADDVSANPSTDIVACVIGSADGDSSLRYELGDDPDDNEVVTDNEAVTDNEDVTDNEVVTENASLDMKNK